MFARTSQTPPHRPPRHPRAPLLAIVWAAVVGAVLVVVVRAAASLPYEPPSRPRTVSSPALFERATTAYRQARWAEARRDFEALRAMEPDHARTLDYLDRLDAIAREAAALEHAEEALAAGRSGEAARLAGDVPPNSPLFGQAEALLRVSSDADGPPGAMGSGRAGDGSAPPELAGLLQQADALYREGNFAAAAARARELARRAEGEVQRALGQWAERCEQLGGLFESLGGVQDDSALGGARITQATAALGLDRELGGAHARSLRPRVVEAYHSLATRAWLDGNVEGACARWVEGQRWAPQPGAWQAWPRRCRQAAQAAVDEGQSKMLRGLGVEARTRFESALRMVPPGDPLYQRARRALGRR